AENFFSSRIEELAPRILASDDAIGSHHSGERAERQPVAGESRAGELPLGGLADVRKAVRRFDHLARPTVRDVDATVHRSQRSLETIEARVRIGGLTRLVILAAEDDDVEVAMPLEAQIVIRIGRVPEERVGQMIL